MLAGEFLIVPALNLAICWKHFFIVIIESQSAGNLFDLNLLGILRDYTPSIINCSFQGIIIYKNEKIKHFLRPIEFRLLTTHSKNKSFNYTYNYTRTTRKAIRAEDINLNENFYYYLTGLIEGDGTIIVPKTERSSKGKLNYPSIQISFDSRDLPLALVIQQKLGFGSISKTKGVNAYRLTINNYDGLINIANTLNGKFRTVKINDFYLLIDFLNKRFSDLKIIKKELDNSNLKNNSWLSGFIDSDGHFFVRARFKYNSISCGFELVQANLDHKGRCKKDIMLILSETFHVNLKSVNKNYCKGKLQYVVKFSNIKSNLLLIDYLSCYPLFSSKVQNYNDYCEVVNMINNKVHKTDKGLLRISEIIKTMNSRRQIFIWDHLKNFYNINN